MKPVPPSMVQSSTPSSTPPALAAAGEDRSGEGGGTGEFLIMGGVLFANSLDQRLSVASVPPELGAIKASVMPRHEVEAMPNGTPAVRPKPRVGQLVRVRARPSMAGW